MQTSRVESSVTHTMLYTIWEQHTQEPTLWKTPLWARAHVDDTAGLAKRLNLTSDIRIIYQVRKWWLIAASLSLSWNIFTPSRWNCANLNTAIKLYFIKWFIILHRLGVMEKIMLLHIPKAVQWLLSECINPPLLHFSTSFLSCPAVARLGVFFWSHVNRLQIIQIWRSRSWTVCRAWHILSECNKR